MSFEGIEIAATVPTGLPTIPLAVTCIFSLMHNRSTRTQPGEVLAGCRGSGDAAKTVRPTSHVAARISTYGTALVLLVLAAASFGLRVRGFHEYDADGSYAQATHLFHNASRMNTAFDIICWILTMPLIGLAGYNREPMLGIRGCIATRTSHIYATAACVWFARFLWHLIYQCGYVLSADRG